MSKDESLVIKVQARHINIKTFIFPPLKNLGCYLFNARLFRKCIFLLLLWSDSSLWYIQWVVFFLLWLQRLWGGGRVLRLRYIRWQKRGRSEYRGGLSDLHMLRYILIYRWARMTLKYSIACTSSCACEKAWHKETWLTKHGLLLLTMETERVMHYISWVFWVLLYQPLQPNLPEATALPLFNGYLALVMQLS